MAILDRSGNKVSYDSEDLIEELESDIKEFGDFKTLAYIKFQNGAKIYYDYQFNDESSKKLGGRYDTLNAERLLDYLKLQDSII